MLMSKTTPCIRTHVLHFVLEYSYPAHTCISALSSVSQHSSIVSLSHLLCLKTFTLPNPLSSMKSTLQSYWYPFIIYNIMFPYVSCDHPRNSLHFTVHLRVIFDMRLYGCYWVS